MCAVNTLAKEGYGYLLGNGRPFCKRLKAIQGLPENSMSYGSGYTVKDVSGEQAGRTSI